MKIHPLAYLGALVMATLLCVVLAFNSWTSAQEKQPAPLTEVQRLHVQNAIQRIQIAQLQLQNAQGEFERARTDAQKLFDTLKVEGYELNLQTMQYEKVKK